MSEYEPDYSDAAANQRDRAADLDDYERAWAEARQDTLTRDAPARRTPCPYCGRTANHRQSCQLFAVHVERVRDAGYADDDPKGRAIA